MSGDNGGKRPLQCPGMANVGVPLVGMPCVIHSVLIPVHGRLTCNCGAGEELTAAGSPVTCPSCGRVYTLSFNPSTSKIDVTVGVPEKATS